MPAVTFYGVFYGVERTPMLSYLYTDDLTDASDVRESTSKCSGNQ